MSAIGQTHGIDFKAALEEGNEDLAAGFWWVKHNGEMRVAEWRYDWMPKKGKRWQWDFTRGEICRPGPHVEPVEMLTPPAH